MTPALLLPAANAAGEVAPATGTAANDNAAVGNAAQPGATVALPADAPAPAAPAATKTAVGFPMATQPQGAKPAGAGSIGGALLALVLVVGLILLLGRFAKRVPGIGGATNPSLKLVGTLSLGPRERVVVVDVGGTQLLLGTGAAGTRVLHTLETPLPAPPVATPSPFAQALARQLGRKSP